MRVKKAVISAGSAAAVAGTAAVIGLTGITSAMAAPANSLYGPKAADRAAVAYVRQHYRGTARVRVLATERDVERGYRVYDVRLVAPNHITYVAHVSRVSDKVLWISRAESQGGGGAVAGSATATATATAVSADRADRADRGDKSPNRKSDHGDRKDHHAADGGSQHDS